MKESYGGWNDPEPFYRWVAPLLNRVLGWWLQIRISGAEHLPPQGPVLLVANHVSAIDPIGLALVGFRLGRRVRFLALHSLFHAPVSGWALRVTRMIPVHRGEGVDRMAADAAPALAAGQAVLVYPEGRIVRAGERSVARPGAGLIALATGVPVVPVASWGLGPGQGRRFRRHVGAVLGPPLDLEPWEGRVDRTAQIEVATAMLAAVDALIPQARATAAGPSRSTPLH